MHGFFKGRALLNLAPPPPPTPPSSSINRFMTTLFRCSFLTTEVRHHENTKGNIIKGCWDARPLTNPQESVLLWYSMLIWVDEVSSTISLSRVQRLQRHYKLQQEDNSYSATDIFRGSLLHATRLLAHRLQSLVVRWCHYGYTTNQSFFTCSFNWKPAQMSLSARLFSLSALILCCLKTTHRKYKISRTCFKWVHTEMYIRHQMTRKDCRKTAELYHTHRHTQTHSWGENNIIHAGKNVVVSFWKMTPMSREKKQHSTRMARQVRHAGWSQ